MRPCSPPSCVSSGWLRLPGRDGSSRAPSSLCVMMIPNRVKLSGEHTLTLRAAGVDDIDGLVALYDALRDDDRYLRFFSLYRPGRAFIEHMVEAPRERGLQLVAAVTTGAQADEQIVGEAGYTLLPNGNGELGITIDETWRGWLGPFLLDALLDEAAARGVPNVEADILLANKAMLTLARSRGYATAGHTDWSTVRVVMGTSGREPTWPRSHDHQRVLVEVPGGRWHAEGATRRAGLDVLACPGPVENRRCPALAGIPCPLAAHADAIVVVPPKDDERWQALLEAHALRHHGIPICVEVPADAQLALPDDAVRAAPDEGTSSIVALVDRLARQPEPTRAKT